MPFVNKYLPIVKKVKSTENRALAEEPEFDIELLDPFPDAFEEYYNDHFSLRNNYNNYYNYLKFFHFGINPNPKKVLIGRDNWLFYNTNMTPAKRSDNLLTGEELLSIKKELLRREKFLNDNNSEFYIGVIPAKPSVYYDMIKPPDYLLKHDSVLTIGEQMSNYLNETSGLNVIYLRDALLNKKAEHQLYFKYDHHSNNMGGFIIAQEMLEFIRKDSNISADQIHINNYSIETKRSGNGNLAKLLGVAKYCIEDKPYLYIRDSLHYPEQIEKRKYKIPEGFKYTSEYELRNKTGKLSLSNAMIIRDSFGHYFKDFIASGFNETLFIWDKWEYELNEDIFIEEKPDVMILMILESHVRKLMKNETESY